MIQGLQDTRNDGSVLRKVEPGRTYSLAGQNGEQAMTLRSPRTRLKTQRSPLWAIGIVLQGLACGGTLGHHSQLASAPPPSAKEDAATRAAASPTHFECAPAPTAVIRDFDSAHADFQPLGKHYSLPGPPPVIPGLVLAHAEDGLPVLNPGRPINLRGITDAASFADWFSLAHPPERVFAWQLPAEWKAGTELEYANPFLIRR